MERLDPRPRRRIADVPGGLGLIGGPAAPWAAFCRQNVARGAHDPPETFFDLDCHGLDGILTDDPLISADFSEALTGLGCMLRLIGKAKTCLTSRGAH